MKKLAAILLVLAAAIVAPAQEKSNQLSPTVRLYQPKNISVKRAQSVAQFISSIMSGPIQVAWESGPECIVIRGGTLAEQDAAEVLLRRFDVAETGPVRERLPSPSSYEITVYLVRAATDPDPAQKSSPELGAIPKELDSALVELKQNFSYRNYRLWDTVITQAASGPVELGGILPSAKPVPDMYALTFNGAGVGEDKAISLSGFEFVLRQSIFNRNDPIVSRIAHSVTLHEGQKLVLGKIRMLPAENADLFLIMTAKIK